MSLLCGHLLWSSELPHALSLLSVPYCVLQVPGWHSLTSLPGRARAVTEVPFESRTVQTHCLRTERRAQEGASSEVNIRTDLRNDVHTRTHSYFSLQRKVVGTHHRLRGTKNVMVLIQYGKLYGARIPMRVAAPLRAQRILSSYRKCWAVLRSWALFQSSL